METSVVEARSILTPTRGFLSEGFTHSLNPYGGCAFGNSACGLYCYAAQMPFLRRGRTWGQFLDVKVNGPDVLRRQLRLARASKRVRPLNVFMSSVTDPYPPQERKLGITHGLLEVFAESPPDRLVVQTRSPLVTRDAMLLKRLAKSCSVQINVTIETDMAVLPAGLGRHAFAPLQRIEALAQLRDFGLTTVAVVAPMLPLVEPEVFARKLVGVASAIILDHYLLGDGSQEGSRTMTSKYPQRLIAAGFEAWTKLPTFWSIVRLFQEVAGPKYPIGVSKAGFNATLVSALRQANNGASPQHP